jgi:hypothetical protein
MKIALYGMDIQLMNIDLSEQEDWFAYRKGRVGKTEVNGDKT